MFDVLIYNKIATLSERHSASNLALGYLSMPPPSWMIDILFNKFETVEFSEHPYGSIYLRTVVSEEINQQTAVHFNPVSEVTITGSASEAIFAAIISLVNRGDEVIIFEPAFSTFAPIVIMAGGIPRFIRINYRTREFEYESLNELFQSRIKLLILNNPHSPTGKVFSREELEFIALLCNKWGTLVLSDEVFDRINWDSIKYQSISCLPEMRDKTIIIGDTGKKFNLNGLKVGYIAAANDITKKLRALQQLITYRLPTAIEDTFAEIIRKAPQMNYYEQLIAELKNKQKRLRETLSEFGSLVIASKAGYFILMETKEMGFDNSFDFSKRLIEEWGVSSLPGQALYWHDSPHVSDGNMFVRFCFAKDDIVLNNSIKLLKSACKGMKSQ